VRSASLERHRTAKSRLFVRCEEGCSVLEKVAWWLVLIGALNWLLVGVFQFDVVSTLFGGSDVLISRILYTLVGIAGAYLLPQAFGVQMIPRKK
jgi:uncharacterized membrane protein YuzA (DUF378 family)